uniref:BHLH domain-containing protein n=1 Tax=Echeneis naucrates TaxID=173247 RepID=A0A665X5L6_ECHNA
MAAREISSRYKYRRPPAIKQEQDDDSDADETHLGLETQIIHSGHFMVSSPHSEHPPKKGYDFDTVNKQTCQTYHFGKASTSHLSIDASLTKLFECMTLAYSGKLVSPKWKNFKGLKLLWRDKIRLNNAIWRAWYMQYVEKRENPVCHFVTPLDGSMDLDVNRSAEAIATEGKCWKRRIEIVIREYHKWRTYFKKRLQKHKDDDLSSLLKGPEEQLSLFGEVSPDMLRVSFYQDEETAARRAPRKHNEPPAPMEMDTLFDMDVLMSEFSDTLFSTLSSHQTIPWPNPREIAHAGNADMIQPGLIPLQPNLDFMDSFDPLQGSSKTPPIAEFVPFSSVIPCQGQLMSSMQLTTNHISPPGSLPIISSIVSQTNRTGDAGGDGDGAAYVQNYMALFPGQVAPTDQDMGSGAPMVPSALDNRSTLDETVGPSVITHTASSTVTASNAATTFSHGPEYGSISTQHPPPPPLLQPMASMSATPVQQPQTFAMPRPFLSSSANKTRPVQRIAPANTIPPSHLILGVLFVNRRTTHISAEQKRRSNIKIGFKTLCNLVPTLKSQSNSSNAVTLQKTVDHIGKLQQERQQLQEEVKRLREEIEELNTSINLCQEQLPATGVPVRRHHFNHIQEKFNEYVKNRTLQDWKFWIFSIIIKPLFESFNEMVSTTSRAELCQTTLQWLDRHCSLPMLRPMVLSTLRQLSTTTSILSDPSLLPEEAIHAVAHTDVAEEWAGGAHRKK